MSAVSGFEDTLFPVIQEILTNDVTGEESGGTHVVTDFLVELTIAAFLVPLKLVLCTVLLPF